MSATWALFRKGVSDARWMLFSLCLALFGLSWLFVFFIRRIQDGLRAGTGGGARGLRAVRGMGGAAMDNSVGSIVAALWNHPVVLLLVATWAIARGSAAVAGEIERGTMDMIASRPITRSGYLASQVAVALFGILCLLGSMLAGNQVGTHFNPLEAPPPALALCRPLLNLGALVFAIYGYTCLLSTVDLVRWRPNLIGSFATIAGYVILVMGSLDVLSDNFKWLEKLSIFKAYDPAEAFVKAEGLAWNAGMLGLVGLLSLAAGFAFFLRRDIPTNS